MGRYWRWLCFSLLKRNVCTRAHKSFRPALISGYSNLEAVTSIYNPPSLGYLQQLYTWVEGGTAGIKYLAQEDKTTSLARVRTRLARSGFKRTNHEEFLPPSCLKILFSKNHNHPPYHPECSPNISSRTYLGLLVIVREESLTQITD